MISTSSEDVKLMISPVMISPNYMYKLAVALLILAPALVFWPVGGYAFLDWDDTDAWT